MLSVSCHRTVTIGIMVVCVVASVSLAYPRMLIGQTQAEMNQTAARDYHSADREMNRAYNRLIKALDSGRKAKLIKAQQAWIKFRDAEADFRASDSEGGSIHPLMVSSSLEDLTKRRTRELKDAYKQFANQ